ncbi:MAG: hypothetical protein ACLUKN_09725 [Bacilli bacterium]
MSFGTKDSVCAKPILSRRNICSTTGCLPSSIATVSEFDITGLH